MFFSLMKNFLNSVTRISKIRGIIIYCSTFFSLTSSENLAPPHPPKKNNENKKKSKKKDKQKIINYMAYLLN